MKNLMKKIRKSNKGFTLVELIIVVAIIAVLSAVVAPQYIKYVERSRQGVDASTLEEVRHAVEIEAAVLETVSAANVTIAIDSTTGVGTIGGSLASDPLGNVTAVTGPTITTKSKAVKGKTFQIDIDANGKVTWNDITSGENAANDSASWIDALQAGTL